MNIWNTKEYIEKFLKIKTKDNRIVPFKLNEPQLRLYEIIKNEFENKKPVRIVILKARQMGFSTVTEAILFKITATKKNVNTLIIAHKEESTSNLYNMSKLFFEELPDLIKPMKKAKNARELIFENPTPDMSLKRKKPGLRSKIKCATAGGHGVGRSDTLTCVHASEFAFWAGDKKETYAGLMQAVPNLPQTMVIIESTANGYEDFKELWDNAVKGENDFIPVFFPWFEMADYSMKYNGFQLTSEEYELQKNYNLTLDQLTWRRWCIKNNCNGSLEMFHQEYPACPEEAFISTGSCIFDKAIILTRINELKDLKPFKTGHFEYDYDGINIKNIRFIEGALDIINIFVDKLSGEYYTIGGDTAGEGSDCFTGQVINNTTGVQCAVLKHTTDEDLYAKQMYCLGVYYNSALLAIEVNFSTYPVRELERLKYSNMFVRITEDNFTHKIKKAFGFKTTMITRPLILGMLVTLVRDNIECFNDINTLKEMLTFVKNEDGRAEAAEGQHDDLVMAMAIVNYARQQQRIKTDDDNKNNKTKWTKDMLEDYRKASKAERAYLKQKWGEPL